jgi:multiple sugar transport system permease protein
MAELVAGKFGSGRGSRHPLVSLSNTPAAYLFLLPVVVVLAGLVAYPLLDGIATSLTDRSVGRPGEFVAFSNFAKLWGDPIYRIATMNSILVTTVTVAAKTILGLFCAVVLTQRFPLRSLVRTLVFLPWAVPGLIAGLSWRWLFDETSGVLNAALFLAGAVTEPVAWLSDPQIAMGAIIVASVWHGLPFFAMMFIAGMTAIPRELYEAAALDGASPWQSFWRVTLPSLKDVMAITVMLSSIWTFNSFHMVFILTGGGPANRTHILPTLAYEYGIRRSELGLGSAVIVSAVPVFLIIIVWLTRRMLRDAK